VFYIGYLVATWPVSILLQKYSVRWIRMLPVHTNDLDSRLAR
jgi:hypothetical protein